MSAIPSSIGTPITGLYGVIAEFSDAQSLLNAATAANERGYTDLDAFSPFPIHGLAEAVGLPKTRLSAIVLGMGILGGLGGFFMCYYANVIAYPLNIGGILGGIGGYMLQFWANAVEYPLNIAGKPFNAWPMFIPVTFECVILGAAGSAVFGMLALNGLPMPYHPVFNVGRFDQASRDKFFLVIQARDPKFDLYQVRDFLDTLQPREITDVPW